MVSRAILNGWPLVPPSAIPSQGGGPRVALFMKTGNSHSVGYDAPLGGDAFAANIYEWKQNGTLAAPSGAQLDDGDTQAPVTARFSQFLPFLNQFAAANPQYARVVIVPQAQGATGFVSGSGQTNADTWSANPAMQPNRLTSALARFAACRNYLIAQGFQVDVVAGIHISALPDVDVSVTSAILAKQNAYADNQDAYIDYVRANFPGFSATTPMIVSHGMNQIQYTGLAADGQTFAAAGHGIPKRRAYAHMIDPIFNRGDGETANLPVPVRSQNAGDTTGDTVHANRVGEATKGRLQYASLAKAIANTPDKLKAPFNGLSSFANLLNLYDFRTGTSRDRQGAGPDLLQAGDAPPIRFSTLFGTDVFDRVGGTGRVFSRAASLPGTYSISTRFSVDAAATQMLLGNTNVAGVDRFTMQITSAGNLFAGHGLTPQINAAIPGFAAGTIMTIGLTYDGTTLTAYKDGIQFATAGNSGSPVAAPNPTTTLYLGANGPDFTAPFVGDMQYLAIFSAALSQVQMQALATATFA